MDEATDQAVARLGQLVIQVSVDPPAVWEGAEAEVVG